MPARRGRAADGAEPFNGFPSTGVEFFQQLAAHNTREWFHGHKDVYEAAARAPMQALAAALEPRWGRAWISRINNDLRFARGRPPYKTHIAAAIGGRYISLSPDGLWVGAGLYRPEPARLKKLRAAIDDARTGRQLETILATLRKKGYGIGTHDRVASAPRGYRPDHPRLELLQMKDIYAGREFAPAPWLSTPGARERIERVMTETGPLVAWLRKNVPAETGEAGTPED
jgi:uncharacterized protein (TIGR02453 family)